MQRKDYPLGDEAHRVEIVPAAHTEPFSLEPLGLRRGVLAA